MNKWINVNPDPPRILFIYINTYIHIHIHLCIRKFINIYTHTHTHTHIHIHIHTYIHTCIQLDSLLFKAQNRKSGEPRSRNLIICLDYTFLTHLNRHMEWLFRNTQENGNFSHTRSRQPWNSYASFTTVNVWIFYYRNFWIFYHMSQTDTCL